MKKLTRPSANRTRECILEAAKAVFLAHGFDGAKTQMIAKQANVHSNLIFHHFTNKENLWLSVKEMVLSQSIELPDYDTSSAEHYFKSLLDYRFKLYGEHPDVVKLIQWQQLTENQEELVGNDFASPNHWLKDIRAMQEEGKIKKTVDPKLIMLFIIYSSHAPFMQTIIPLSKMKMNQYKKIILDACLNQFGVGT